MKSRFWLTVLFSALLSASAAGADPIPVKNGDKIAFLGDSITECGWCDKPTGYVHLVIDGLRRAGVEAVPIPAGISGSKSPSMILRLEKVLLPKNPQWVLLNCGVNDVWHGAQGVPLEKYKENMTRTADIADKAGIKLMILTATMIGEDPSNKENVQLAPYNEFLRTLAKERKYPLADLSADMLARVAAKTDKKALALTLDGVHMNAYGNQMMAACILKTFGVPEKDVAEDIKAWNALPGAFTVRLGDTSWNLSVNEYEKLTAGAAKRNLTREQYLKTLLEESIREKLN